jgi:TBC1 domain family member 14
VTRLFDCFVLEGDSFLFRVALALLQTMEARLLSPDKDELAAVFRGEDKGARAIVARAKGIAMPEVGASAEGGETQAAGSAFEGLVGPDEVYEQYGATEETLFYVLQSMEWKETTWTRLVERELPENSVL